MNSDLIMQILQWLVPSGIAGSLWAWLRHRENNKVLAAKERNDAYKEIQRYVAENCYEIPLLTPIFAYGTRDYVTFFDADPSNVPNLKSVTFAQ